MEEPALRQKHDCKAGTPRANMVMKAAITATVACIFGAVYLLTWEASESLYQRAIQAKTTAYNQTLRTKQPSNCSVSHSFSWSLSSHNVRSDQQYCVLLSKQVEARAENIHLRCVYCTKCPTSCPSYKEICADRTCYASPTVPVPHNTEPWPASCAHVTTGTPCTTSCKKGYKPATEGSPPSATCMTGDIAGQSPFQDAWSPAMGSCVPDRLELQHIIKAMRIYHVIEGMACLLWCYCVWYLKAFGLSAVAAVVHIRYPILHSTLVKPDLWTMHRLVELCTIVIATVSMVNCMETTTSVVIGAVAGLLATSKWSAIAYSRLCEFVYVGHAYAACYLTLLCVQPTAALMTWTLALVCAALKPLWHRIEPILACGMSACLELSGQLAMHYIPYFEVDLDLQLESVGGEATILFENVADSAARTPRGSERGGSKGCERKVSFASNSSQFDCFVDGVDFVLWKVQLLVKTVLVALRLDSSGASDTSFRSSEVDEPLDTIVEGDETAGSDGLSGNSSSRASDAASNESEPAAGTATTAEAHSSSAGALPRVDVMSFGPLLSFGSDVGAVVQIALSPQSAAKKAT